MRTITNCPPKVKAAMDKTMLAYAAWRAAEEIDKASKEKVLAENDFKISLDDGEIMRGVKNGDKITDPRLDYLMSDTDFEKYCRLVYEENLKAGLDSGGAGNTLWPLRKAVLDAENELIDTVAAEIPQYTPEVVKTLKINHKFREKFLKITFGESYQA
jgi:hypothetical protein